MAPGRPLRVAWHWPALVLVAVAVCLQFLRAPGFGDDLTYWTSAFQMHESGLGAWQKKSFHDLRWPVWGVCWLLQSIFGFGLASYYGSPLIFLTGGAWLAFHFGRKITGSLPLGWACALGFLFHPLLDSVSYRPMPDISEGVWSGLVLLAWWAAMTARTRGGAALCALLTGLGVFVTASNRVTGIFITLVLVVATLLLFPRKFGWLILAGFCAALFYGLECFFYKRLFDDWLHNLHANLNATGKKGTEAVPFWQAPARFLDTLWGGIGPAYCIPGVLGLWAGWRKFGVGGRLMVLWFAVLYLSYACAPQSLFPWRPMVRDADRFLSGLAIPMSVLAALGLATLFSPAWLGRWRFSRWPAMHPIASGVFSFVVLSLVTTRDRFSIDYVPEMRRYLASLPAGTKIFTHYTMRPIAFLVNAGAARHFEWRMHNSILHYDARHEEMAATCDELWYARKLLWITVRKQIEERSTVEQPRLASYFEAPERAWAMTRLLAKGDTPDLIFYRRRPPAAPPALVLGPDAPEWQGLLPALPLEWDAATGVAKQKVRWKVPAQLRGKLVRFELTAASDEVEAVTFRLRFAAGDGRAPVGEFLLKPYLYTGRGKDFFALQVPAEADTCEVQAHFSKRTKHVTFTGFRAVIETPAAP